MEENVYFCIPLIGKLASRDWKNVSRLFDQTVQSIFAQDGNFNILVACDDVPDSRFLGNSRLEFLITSRGAPETWRQKIADKAMKLRMLVKEVCRRRGGYVVVADADDLLSNRLTRHIRNTNNKTGYIFQAGYLLNVSGNRFDLSNEFPDHCGTCAVFYLGKCDLTPGSGICTIIESGKHTEYARHVRRLGRELENVPFPAAIYLRHHGDNLSLARSSILRFRRMRNFVRRSFGGSYISNDIRAEFCVPPHY